MMMGMMMVFSRTIDDNKTMLLSLGAEARLLLSRQQKGLKGMEFRLSLFQLTSHARDARCLQNHRTGQPSTLLSLGGWSSMPTHLRKLGWPGVCDAGAAEPAVLP